MSASPILHFVWEHEPNLIFVKEEHEPMSPTLVFVKEDHEPMSPTLLFVKENEVAQDHSPDAPQPPLTKGSFHLEDVDFCSFVLCRGQRKGEMCCRIPTHSFLLQRDVPACIQHLEKYEEIVVLQSSSYLSARRTETPSYAEYDDIQESNSRDSPPRPKISKQKKPFTLDSIPKAIERSRDCIVCFESENPLLLHCGHTVCFDCITRLKKETCPMCRKAFKKETDVHRL